MNRVLVKSLCAAALMLLIAMLTNVDGRAQGRRRGPRDWSHRFLVAARSGPDGETNIGRNWRTIAKHAQIDGMLASRDEFQDWLDKFLGRERKPRPGSETPHLDWNLRTGGYGSVVGYPAKYSFDVSASNCSDVIYFTVDQAGSGSAVNLIAITNAYAGCTGNSTGATPTVKFGIAMGAGTATSASPSLDGKVLYVFESASTGVILHAINVNNITSTPGTYNFTFKFWSSTHTLAAPNGTATSEQLFQITFPGVTNDMASPYLDYDSNQIFFGDSAGRIHRVVNVDQKTASEDTSNFPVSCGTAQLRSPIFWNGQVVATSADGKLYRINTAAATPYTCIAAQQGGAGVTGGAGGALSTPILDVTNNTIIVGSNNAYVLGGRGYGAINLMFTSGQAPASFTLYGTTSTTIAPVEPALDNTFWTTNNGSLVVSGTNSAGTDTYLLRMPYNGGALGSVTGWAAFNHTGTTPGVVATTPVTEFLTAAASNPDYFFVGANGTNYKFINRISAGFGGSDAAPAAMAGSFAPADGVTSGIVIDTRTTSMTGSTATANIYFGTAGVSSSFIQSTIVQLAQAF